MEENMTYQKRTKIFLSVAVIVYTLLYFLLSMLTENIDYKNPTLSSELMLRLPSIAVTVITLTMFFLMGKKLTDDKRKAMIFMASIYFGSNVVNAVTKFFSCGVEAAITLSYLKPDALASSAVVIELIEIPFTVIAAYYAFTAFEGLNSKLGGESLEQSQMPLSRARIRYFAYELIGGIAISIFSTVPTLLISFFAMESIYTNDNYSFIVIATQVASVFTVSADLVLIYIAGYRPFRSRIDAMAFVACSGLSGEISRIFINLLLIPQMLAFNSFTSGVFEAGKELEGVLATAGTTGIFGILTSVISIGLALFMLKYFFSHKLYGIAEQ